MSAWLIDTQALLWFLSDSPRLSPSARQTMEAGENMLLVSAASVAEMAIKTGLGKLAVPDDLPAALEDDRFEELDLRFAHAWQLATLPLDDHKDPFDRMLVAQALVERLPIISNDTALDRYGIQRHW